VTAVDINSRDDGTVKDRLIRAADEEIAARGLNAVQMEVVAKGAGVSRATAFRQLGSVSEMLVQVALLRARRHVTAVEAVMAAKTGVFAKLEAALV
jgi:AcrR family transcriptional regulator